MNSPTSSVHFSNSEIEAAQRLKALGLPWEPTPGHYVLDQCDLIECDSPFQGRVFFILDLKHFLRRSGTLERLKQGMCWLPTWEQARAILADMNVASSEIARLIHESGAISNGCERLELYHLIEQQLQAPPVR